MAAVAPAAMAASQMSAVPAVARATSRPAATPDPSRNHLDRAASAGPEDAETDLERATGLHVSIDSVQPTALTKGENLTLHGVVSDTGAKTWRDAKVYLDIESEPARSRAALDGFRTDTEGFGNRVVDIGRFDEIGKLDADSLTSYQLSIPFGKLPISGKPGVYHVGVTVIATARDGTRPPVARMDTLVPMLPEQSSGGAPLRRTGVVTLIPMAAPIRRIPGGAFLDDDLATSLAFGGQLHNLVDFVAAAPPNTLEVVLDPALRAAVADMADGYRVRSLAEIQAGEPGHPGQGQVEAGKWLNELDQAVRNQDLLFMPWGSPDTSALGSHNMPGVVQAAVRASQRYASDQRITTAVASWPYAGSTTRRGLAVSAFADAPLRIVAQRSLVNLRDDDVSGYPPTQVQVPTAAGQITALVARSDVAGEQIARDTSGQQLMQDIVAEATVRSLGGEQQATSVVAVPFGWDPGSQTESEDLAAAYDFPTVQAQTAASAAQQTAVSYPGPIEMSPSVSSLSTDVLSSLLQLRNKGRIFSELMTDQDTAVPRFDQELAEQGSSLWRDDDQTRVQVIDRTTRMAARNTEQVVVTGPTFVALSSASGRFPLTVTNGLGVPVTVHVIVHAENPAVTVDPIGRLSLAPGQRRDIEATARSEGSGLTGVRIRLTTATNRPVGKAWAFDIRSTQIGLAIWIVMGVGAAILFGAAGRRIYLRIKDGHLRTRQEPSP
jgi:hypothetical protein